jgi:hypothetical protein
MVCICGNLVNLRPHSGFGRGNTQADQREYVVFGIVTFGSRYLRTVTLPTSRRVAAAVLALLGAAGVSAFGGAGVLAGTAGARCSRPVF